MRSFLPWLALGVVGWLALSRRRGESASSAPVGGPVRLQAGVPYLFIVRLGTDVTDERAREVLEPKDVEGLELTPAVNPPFWATTGSMVYAPRVAAFRKTPEGNSTLSLGADFYGIGRLEKLVRLDGEPFDTEATS